MALVVFTGGARSGKSAAASTLASRREADAASVCVLVFGRERAGDPEFAKRIAHHRASRPVAWSTVEADRSDGWAEQVPDGALLLVDCVGTLLGLAMEEAWNALASSGTLEAADESILPQGYEEAVAERFRGALRLLLERCGDTIVVTNEVGDGIVPGYATGRLFRDELGLANRALVGAADAAYLCVAGRLVDLTGLPGVACWPED